jgi:hypothetical protein
LQDGDFQVWYEMLLGLNLGRSEVKEADLVEMLSTPEAFQRSAFANLPFTRQGMLCEFEFYRALRDRMAGKREAWRDGLRRTVATHVGGYWEYALASYLLSQPELN